MSLTSSGKVVRMKHSMLRRSTMREIRQSLGRFFAILSIIALGVGFFSGVRDTTPAMVHTVDAFWQEKQLYDYRLVSTLGWEEQDVAFFRMQGNVRAAEGSQTLDLLCRGEDGADYVLKSHSIPQKINLLELTEGRMPEKANECIMDAGMNLGLSVGDTIYLSGSNSQETRDAVRYSKFKIVGAAHSSYYLNYERGSTSLGNGTVAGYLYLPPEAYEREAFSEIYIRFDQDDQIYSKAYNNAMDAREEHWKALTKAQAEKRYDRIVAEAKKELQKGKDELAEKRAEGLQELEDAAKELGDGKRELASAAKELEDAARELEDARTKLEDAQKELEDAKQKLDDGQIELESAGEQLESSQAQLDSAAAQLAESEQRIADGQAQLDAAKTAIDSNDAALREQANALAAQETELEAAMAYFEMLPPEEQAKLTAGQAALREGREKLNAAQAQITAARQELAAQQTALDDGRNQLAQGRAEYEAGVAAYEEGLQQFEAAKQELADGEQAYADGVQEYENGKRDYEDGLQKYEDGKIEYEDGVREFEDGLKEYQDGKAEFDEKIADAEAELADAEAEIADLEHPDTFVLDRSVNIGYSCFESDSQIVEQVARVFPLFFILVAALVCMTTMSRMVEEQRTGIGTLKALGYSEGQIMGKFAFYAGSAAVIGCVIGFAVGTIVFPTVIWTTYQMMYIPLSIKLVFDWQMALLSLVASLLCSIGATWLSCRIELQETAAGLMRPKAPKAGKRVLLEYLPFLWNRLKFLHKVSIRNIFRYKGRFFMMVVGIGGCTALLLTGFGLKDTVADFAEVQYNEIVTADASLGFRNDIHGELPAKLKEVIDAQSEKSILLRETMLDLVTKDTVKAMNILIPDTPDTFGNFMNLHTVDGEPLQFPGKNEAYVSNSVHDRYGVSVGDTITLRSEDMKTITAKVTGIFENHVYNYVLLTPETYASQMNEDVPYNAAYLNFAEGADGTQVSAALSGEDDITNVVLFAEMQERIGKMMSSLNYVVALVIVCAAGLAFIVLYNLTNINITERIREIATIKVLGFFRGETEAYVLRENIALTAIGILAGLGLGVLLHRFVISQIIVDLVSFKVQILPMSYVWSILLTFGFNLLVNLVMGIKLDRINMAESLKSVD